MWPFSTIGELRSQVGLLNSAVASWQERTDTMRRRAEKAEGKVEVLDATLRERDRQQEVLRHDYEVLRSDFNRVVGTLGNMATRPIGGPIFEDADPFKEDKSLPDVYVTPEEGAGPDFEALMNEMTETKGGERAE